MKKKNYLLFTLLFLVRSWHIGADQSIPNVNPNATDMYGETQLHRAVRFGDVPTITLLLQLGADPTIQNKKGESALDIAHKFGVPLQTIIQKIGVTVQSPRKRDPKREALRMSPGVAQTFLHQQEQAAQQEAIKEFEHLIGRFDEELKKDSISIPASKE